MQFTGRVPVGPVLKFSVGIHAAVRAFVFRRDGFACVKCGKKATPAPDNYTGRYSVRAGEHVLEIDHIIPRSRGGTHHPDNLQTMCINCNCRKGVS